MSDLENAARALRENTSVVVDLRGGVLIQQMLKAFKASKRFQIDEENLVQELQDILNEASVKSLRLPGTQGLKDASEMRFAVQGARDRVVAMNQELRTVLLAAKRAYQTGSVWLRQQPQLSGMTVKAMDDVACLVLAEVSECISIAERLLAETKETLASLDDRTRTIDSWFMLHKQYVFLSLNRGSRADKEDDEE